MPEGCPHIVLPEGGTLAVLLPVAYLADNDADVDAFIASQSGAAAASAPVEATIANVAGAPAAAPANAAVVENGRAKASPAARKIAGERHIDLTRLPAGSGPGGRIISTDVPLTAPATRPAATAAPGGTRKHLSQMRKAIARNLSLSKQTIPHFYVRLTINAEPLFAFYQGEKQKYPVSLNDVVVLAFAKAIMEFPAFAAGWTGMKSRSSPRQISAWPWPWMKGWWCRCWHRLSSSTWRQFPAKSSELPRRHGRENRRHGHRRFHHHQHGHVWRGGIRGHHRSARSRDSCRGYRPRSRRRKRSRLAPAG